MSTYPSWKLNNNFKEGGHFNYAGKDENPLWNTGKKEFLNLSIIDLSSKPQTIWFRNLQLMLQRNPVVRLHIRNKDKKLNSATYLIKSLTRSDTHFSIQLQFVESTSTDSEMGPLDTICEFYYY
jgi:hypothetical protein